MRHLLLASLLLTAPLALRSQTTSLAVTNFDFETGGGLVDGGFSSGTIPTGWSAIPGNAPTGSYYGYFNPDDKGYTGAGGTPGTIGTMSGPNVFYFGSCATGQGIQQTLGSTFALNTTYQTTFSLGCRNDPTYQASISVQLLAGSSVLASGTFLNSTADTFADYAITYAASTANTSLVGMPLTVSFAEYDQNGTVTEVDLDNVRVTATAVVPEPSTWTLLSLGVVGACAVALRRRRAGV